MLNQQTSPGVSYFTMTGELSLAVGLAGAAPALGSKIYTQKYCDSKIVKNMQNQLLFLQTVWLERIKAYRFLLLNHKTAIKE